MMQQRLFVYNTLTRKKEEFVPLHAPNVVCTSAVPLFTVTRI